MPSRMPKRILYAVVFALFFFFFVLAGSLRKTQGAAARDLTAATSDKDQVDLSLTVYNGNLALVRDVRQVHLQSGVFPLRFEGVASSINPTTVHFRSLTAPSRLSVVEQNYEYDLLDPQKLLQKYVGREVTLVRPETNAGTTRWVETKALLLSNNGSPVWKIGNEIVTGMGADSYRFPDLPENLYSQPTLVWTLDNRGADSQRVEASYLAGSMNWSADYVLNVARDEKSADLDGWVTLTNNSGTAFHNAHLQLIAGDLNRLPVRGRNVTQMVQVEAAAAAVPAPQFQQENFSEYHLYTLGRRTSVENQETKQISLLQGTAVPVEKIFVVNGQNYYYRNAQNPGSPIKDSVMVYYKFKNEEKAGLGMPLPAGSLRVYQKDSKGGILFVGEDHIDHIPKDEDISVHIGNAFDVVAERKQTDFQKIDTRTWEMEFEITLRNHKDTPVTVQVNEPIGGDWEMLSSTYKFTKMAAFAAQFNVPVDKNGTSVLKYRIRAHW
jgi:hypothetical protein